MMDMRKALLAALSLGFSLNLHSQSTTPLTNFYQITDGVVNTTAVSGSTLYLGGSFNGLGPSNQHGVSLDASTGSYVQAFPVPNNTVTAVVADGNGGWYIGGAFTSIGGVTRNRLARINRDGSLHPWNPSLDGVVNALAMSDSKLYVGGAFLNITPDGGVAASRTRLASFDLATGALDSWAPAISNGFVYALLVVGGNLYVGGDFLFMNAGTAGVVNSGDYQYLGSFSLSTGAPNLDFKPRPNAGVYALATDGTTVYAGGSFTAVVEGTSTNRTRNGCAAFTNSTGALTSWNPNAVANRVSALAVSGNTVYVGGNFTNIGGASPLRPNLAAVDKATGALNNTWNPGADAIVVTLLVSGSTVYVGGSFSTIAGQTRNRIAALDATTGTASAWDPSASTATGSGVRCLAVNGDKVYVGGTFNSMNVVARDGLAAIDMTTGKATSWNPNPILGSGEVNKLLVHSNTLYVGGTFTSFNPSGTATTRNRLASFDLTSGVASNTVSNWNPNLNGTLYDMVVSGTTLYIGGTFTSVGGSTNTRNRLASFDLANSGTLTSWNPGANELVKSLAVQGNRLFVGGFFTLIGTTTRNRFAAFDLSVSSPSLVSYTSNPSFGVTGDQVNAIAANGSRIFVGGTFTQPRDRVLSLNTSAALQGWDPIPNNVVEAIALNDNTLFIGGIFSNSTSGINRNRVAAFSLTSGVPSSNSPTDWNPLVQGTGTVYSLTLTNDYLIVGGAFDGFGSSSDKRRGLGVFPLVDCVNPTSGGTIASAQTGSSPFNPSEIISTEAASGFAGTLEYKWQSSTSGSTSGFTDIASSNSSTYDPGPLTQTTWFKRLARYTCNTTTWTGASESNVIQVTVHSSFTWNGSASTEWNTAANWTPNFVPSTGATITIPSGLTNYPVTPSTVTMTSLTVTSAGYALGSSVVTLTGNLTNNGSITGTGRVLLGGSTAQTISGTGTISNLEVNNSAGVIITSGAGNMQSLTGVLTPTAGTLTTNGNLTLKSNASGTARVAEHTTSGSISGTVAVERFVDVQGRAKQWRTMGFPYSGTMTMNRVSGIALDYTAGSRSVMYYNEGSDNGTYGSGTGGRNAGYQSLLNATDPIPAGQGVMLWLYGDGNTGGNADKGSMSGTLTMVSSGSLNESGNAVSLPVYHTASKQYHGWNLVSNPFASAIDWASGSITKTGISHTIYRWNPASASWTTYNSQTDARTPANVDGIIESGGAFFVEALADNPVLSIGQGAKVSSATALTHFSRAPGRLELPQERARTAGTVKLAGIRLSVKGQGNPEGEEAYLDLSRQDATSGFDGLYDAVAMDRTSGAGVGIRDREEKSYAMQFDAPIAEAGVEKRYYPIRVTSPAKGATTLELWTEGAWNPLNSVSLIDRKEGRTLLMQGGRLSYPFTMDEQKSADRFQLAINHVKVDGAGAVPGFDVRLLGNPVRSERIDLLLTHPSAQPKNWSVMDNTGRTVGTGGFGEGKTGNVQHRVTVPGMRQPGVYVLKVEMDNGDERSVQVVRN